MPQLFNYGDLTATSATLFPNSRNFFFLQGLFFFTCNVYEYCSYTDVWLALFLAVVLNTVQIDWWKLFILLMQLTLDFDKFNPRSIALLLRPCTGTRGNKIQCRCLSPSLLKLYFSCFCYGSVILIAKNMVMNYSILLGGIGLRSSQHAWRSQYFYCSEGHSSWLWLNGSYSS